MPSLFKTSNVETLERRRVSVEREIAGLVAFRDRIDRRISHLKTKPDNRPAEVIIREDRDVWPY